jgi:prevent-host-death family protein
MSIHTFSSRDFTRDVSAAKRAAVDGPVFITDRGRPAFALLKIDDYYRMAGKSAPSLLQVMDGIPCGEGIDFDPPKLGLQIQAASLD